MHDDTHTNVHDKSRVYMGWFDRDETRTIELVLAAEPLRTELEALQCDHEDLRQILRAERHNLGDTS